MSSPERTRLCPYCRQEVAAKSMERDHVPPRCIFPDIPPENLLTVYCCPKCHDDLSKGDEPLLAMVSAGLGRSAKIIDARTRSNRGLRENPWFKKTLVDAAKNTAPTPMMVYGKVETAYPIKIGGEMKAAIDKSIRRIATGIIFKRRPDWNPHDHELHIVQLPESDEKAHVVAHFFLAVSPLEHDVVLDEDIFDVQWGFAADRPQYGLLAMTFYAGLTFAIFIGPKGESYDHFGGPDEPLE